MPEVPPWVLLALVLAGVVLLGPVARRLRAPLPVVLTVYGLGLAFIPGAGPLPLSPELILPVVLPPLLFAATLRSTVGRFRRDARPIAVLAVGLTLASAAAVAVVAHLLGFGWPEAAVLGAVVSPPDPVAATAVARRLSLPERLVTLLEGEGLFNDATALVLYGSAVAAVVTGEVSAGSIGSRLVVAVVAGLGAGLVAGVACRWALSVLRSDAAETTLTVAMPFATYLAADRLGASGVLAVLALGLYLRDRAHPAITSGGWLLGRAVWSWLDFAVTSVVFVLVGVELAAVIADNTVDARLLVLTGGVVLTLVVLRLVWMFPAVSLAGVGRGSGRSALRRGERVVAGWAGMRGVVTVATALSLPETTTAGRDFPQRSTIVLVALATVLLTLVAQGLSLPVVVRRAGIRAERGPRGQAAALRQRAAEAALEVLREAMHSAEVPDVVHRAAILRYESLLRTQEAVADALAAGEEEAGDDEAGEAAEEHAQMLRRLLRAATDAEREVVLRARGTGEVSVESADEVLTRIESRALRDLD